MSRGTPVGISVQESGHTMLWNGMEWNTEYGMEGKNGYGIWNGSSMEWKI